MFGPETRCKNIVVSIWPKTFFFIVSIRISLHSVLIVMCCIVLIAQSTEFNSFAFVGLVNNCLILMFFIVGFLDDNFWFIVLKNKFHAVFESFNSEFSTFIWAYLSKSVIFVGCIYFIVLKLIFFQPFLGLFLCKLVFREQYGLDAVHYLVSVNLSRISIGESWLY